MYMLQSVYKFGEKSKVPFYTGFSWMTSTALYLPLANDTDAYASIDMPA